MNQPEYVIKAQKGDPSAFDELYIKHRGRVFNLCLRMVKNREQAEDITQDVFVNVLRFIPRFKGDSQFTTWLHSIARNTCLMYLRKPLVKKPQHSLDDPLPDNPQITFADNISREDTDLNNSVGRITVEYAINQLPPGYRNCFIMIYIDGYEYQEAANIMGVNIGTVKSQVHKARKKIKELLT